MNYQVLVNSIVVGTSPGQYASLAVTFVAIDGPPDTYAAYDTRDVDQVNGVDAPGAPVYKTLQYGANDFLVQRQRRLIVKGAYSIPANTQLTLPTDNGSVTTGYRVIEGDITSARPVVALNNGGFYLSNGKPITGWVLRWLKLQGLGNVAQSALPGGVPPKAPIHHGYSTDFIVEGVNVDGVFNTQPTGNCGFLGYNMGSGDQAHKGVWNQCAMTNCGCNTSGGSGDTSRNAMVYAWEGSDLTVTNCTADCWSHFFYMKGATAPQPPENITCYGNKVTRNKVSDSPSGPAFRFEPISAPNACPGGIYWHHNLVVDFGVAFLADNYNTPVGGVQGTDVQIYQNTAINCGSLYGLQNCTHIKLHDNVHVPAANADAMCGMTRPANPGYALQFDVFDGNAYYSGLGFSTSAWQLDRYGTPQHNFGSFAAWQKAHTSTGTTELLSDPDATGLTFPDLSAAFTDFANGDYTSKAGGPIVGKGCYDGTMPIGQTWS